MSETIVETNEPGIQMESVITECRNPKCRKKLRITVKLARKQAIHCTACQVDFQLNNETIDQLIQDAQQVTTYPPIELQVGKSGQSESTSVEPQSVQTPKTTRWGQSRSTLASKIRRFKQSEWYLVMVTSLITLLIASGWLGGSIWWDSYSADMQHDERLKQMAATEKEVAEKAELEKKQEVADQDEANLRGTTVTEVKEMRLNQEKNAQLLATIRKFGVPVFLVIVVGVVLSVSYSPSSNSSNSESYSPIGRR